MGDRRSHHSQELESAAEDAAASALAAQSAPCDIAHRRSQPNSHRRDRGTGHEALKLISMEVDLTGDGSPAPPRALSPRPAKRRRAAAAAAAGHTRTPEDNVAGLTTGGGGGGGPRAAAYNPHAHNPFVEPLRSMMRSSEDAKNLIKLGDDQSKRGVERLRGVIAEAKELSKQFEQAGANGQMDPAKAQRLAKMIDNSVITVAAQVAPGALTRKQGGTRDAILADALGNTASIGCQTDPGNQVAVDGAAARVPGGAAARVPAASAAEALPSRSRRASTEASSKGTIGLQRQHTKSQSSTAGVVAPAEGLAAAAQPRSPPVAAAAAATGHGFTQSVEPVRTPPQPPPQT